MDVENTFRVEAPPERVYAYLLDINRVVGCVPGAQLSEVVDEQTFRGKVKIKVGPVTVSYDGVARITKRDEAGREATVEAEGREVSGSGSARATTRMRVTPAGEGSEVRFATEFSVVGRAAQFGRGIMQDVSKRLVAQMGKCIAKRLEAEGADAGGGAAAPVSGVPGAEAGDGKETSAAPGAAATHDAVPAAAPPASASPGGSTTSPSTSAPGRGAQVPHPAPTLQPAPAPRPAPAAPMAEPQEAAALDALALARGVAADRLHRVGPARLAAAAGAVLLVVIGLLWRRRR